MFSKRYSFLISILFFSFSIVSFSQNNEKDLVRLIKAKSAQLVEKDGLNYRKIVGPATFLHNGSQLFCDTAYWYVESEKITAIGNVKIIQDQTNISSSSLDYIIADNVAQFRGVLVQLNDKDNNILRTRHLDYNTRDSVATFLNGAAFKDKDGNVIESSIGSYDAKTKIFNFRDEVNMFTDSVFIKTSTIDYNAELEKAFFGYATNIWKDEDILSANSGVYDKIKEEFFFNKNVHVLSGAREVWADSLYYNKENKNTTLLGNIQVTDSVKNISILAGKAHYLSEAARLTLTNKPAIVLVNEGARGKQKKGNAADTTYLGADKLTFYSKKRELLDTNFIKLSLQKSEELKIDPIEKYKIPSSDSLKGKVKEPLLDLKKQEEEKHNFFKAISNVKLYGKDIQMSCDSLTYNTIDSLARLYEKPLLWSDSTRQYSADSVFIMVRNNHLDKANFSTNAFVAIKVDSSNFDQIKGAEMIAYFDSTQNLRRFDVLGQTMSLFHIMEQEVYATANIAESKILSATFKGGEIEKINFFDAVKNNAYPIVQLPKSEKNLKGFSWHIEKRPVSKEDISPYVFRQTQRKKYSSISKAEYNRCEEYFPGYMAEVHLELRRRKELKEHNKRLNKSSLDSMAKENSDSLNAVVSTLRDSTDCVVKDSLPPKSTDDKGQQLTAKEAKKKAKLELMEARRKEREKAREERLLLKRRKRVLRELLEEDKEIERYNTLFKKYRKHYERIKLRQQTSS